MMTNSPTGESLSWLSSPATLVPSSDSQPDTAATGGNAVVAYAAVAVKQGTRSSSSRPSSSSTWKRPQSTSSSSESSIHASPRRAMSEDKRRRRSASRSPARRKPLREEDVTDSKVKCHVIGTPPIEREEEPNYSFLRVHPRDHVLSLRYYNDGMRALPEAVTPGTRPSPHREKEKDTPRKTIPGFSRWRAP